jgi:hypothetical protein
VPHRGLALPTRLSATGGMELRPRSGSATADGCAWRWRDATAPGYCGDVVVNDGTGSGGAAARVGAGQRPPTWVSCPDLGPF